jgi:hypothetical protein
VDDVHALKKDLAAALAEIEHLRLRLANVTFLLKKEMRETGKLPTPKNGDHL